MHSMKRISTAFLMVALLLITTIIPSSAAYKMTILNGLFLVKATAQNQFSVNGATGAIDAYGNIITHGSNLTMYSALTGTTARFSIAGSTGNTIVGGTLSSGAATLASLICTAAGTFGGGEGNAGTTISTAGAITSDGATILRSTLAVTGAITSGVTAAADAINVNSSKFTVQGSTGNTIVAGTLGVTGITTLTGAVTCASTLSAKRTVSADEGDGSTTMTVATYPSGSLITCASATTIIILPAVTSGVTYTFIMKGATLFTLTAPAANTLLCDEQTAGKTNLVWSASALYTSVTVVSDATNWTVIAATTLPTSSS